MSTWVGIDIGASSVKVAVVRSAYRKLVVASLARCEVAVAGGVREALAQATREALGTDQGVGDAIGIAVEGQKATVKCVQLPATAQRQIAEILPFELESQLPFELDDAVFDYRVIPPQKKSADVEAASLAPAAAISSGPATASGPATTPADGAASAAMLSVLVGVAKMRDVSERIALVKEALGSEPERVGVGSLPIANLVPYAPAMADGTVGIVDVGTSSSDIIVLCNGEPVFARTIGLGTSGLPATAAKFARELRTTLASYRAQSGSGVGPSRLFLCGGGAHATGAEAFVASALGIPVELLSHLSLEVPRAEGKAESLSQGFQQAHPRNDGDGSSDARALVQGPDSLATASVASYAKAIGLALGCAPRTLGFNLRKGALAFERGFGWLKERIRLFAGLGTFVVISFLFASWAQFYAQSKEKQVLEQALGMVTNEVLGESTESPTRAMELLNAQGGLPDEDPLPHADAFDVMVKLSEVIPTSMTHDIEELDVQKQHVIVHGIVGSIPDAQAIRDSLSRERCMSDVKVTRTTAQVGGTSQKYVLEFDLKCPEDQKGSKKGSSSSSSAAAGAKP